MHQLSHYHDDAGRFMRAMKEYSWSIETGVPTDPYSMMVLTDSVWSVPTEPCRDGAGRSNVEWLYIELFSVQSNSFIQIQLYYSLILY